MGFHPQPNDWTCGPVALEHALLAIGRTVDPDRLAALAKTHWWSGTGEQGLKRAAARYGCKLELTRKRKPEPARRALGSWLRKRVPVLLCVDNWGHWISVLRCHGSDFLVVDSLDEPVLSMTTWPALNRRWRYLDTDYDEEEPPVLYDMFPVNPTQRPTVRADLSVTRVRYLRRPENRDLALHWTEYLDDLLVICRPPSAKFISKLSMAELLRRHQEMIVSRVVYWHGDVPRAKVERLLRNLRFVAETYGLVVPEASKRRALTDLSVLTTMWAVAHGGPASMYGVDPA